MAPSKKALLKVVEKFRAPAALYQPSKNAGDGWMEISGLRKGGEAIIQLQEDAERSGQFIAVVRFQFRHGKDFLNARIMQGLPIERKGKHGFVFKSSSSNSGGYDIKTVSCLKFTCRDDADDFMMWWLAKNGSIEALNSCEETPEKKKPAILGDATNRLRAKRKAIDSNHPLEPLSKKICKERENAAAKNTVPFTLLQEGKIERERCTEDEINGKSKFGCSSITKLDAVAVDDKIGSQEESKGLDIHEEQNKPSDQCSFKDSDEIEVFIHGGYGAHSQEWTDAFLFDESDEL